MARDCWNNEENKDKRPKNWKVKIGSSSKQATPAVDNSAPTIEIMLCGFSFPAKMGLLDDPDIWIADTAATVHSTPHVKGMTNLKKAGSNDAIVVGNGSNEQAGCIGDIKGVVCDKNGNQLKETVMCEVTHLSTGKFNLFSLSRMIKLGWKMTGDKYAIVLMKGGNKLKFDLVIEV